MGKDLFQYKGMKQILAVLTVLTCIQAAAIIMQAEWLAEAVTRLFNGERIASVHLLIIFFLAAFLLRHAITLVKKRAVYDYAAKTGADMRKSFLEKLFQSGPRLARKEGTGHVVTLAMEGIAQFRRYLELFLPKMISMAVIPAAVVGYVFFKDRSSAVILMVTMPILIAFMILLGYAAKRKADRQWKTYETLSNHFTDSLRGLETLKFLGLSGSHANNIFHVSERYRKATMSTLRIAFLSSFALDFFTMLSVATVAVFLGLGLVEGHIMLGPALAVLILAPEFFLPVREVGNDYHATLNGQEAGKAIKEILDAPSFKEETPLQLAEWSDGNQIKLKEVSVQHDEEDRRSLTDVSLSFKGKRNIGIIGESGAGKSTLIDVLGGFLETKSGVIEVDGTERTHLQAESWQRQLLYIPQHPFIFPDTLSANIRFYHPGASPEEIERAAKAAGLAQLIEQLPSGLEERIGEGGRALSGGQAQRTAIARAFLGNRPILLLDEPTAHLDIETEYEIKQTMLKLFEDKLVFMATHRLHWMLDMDEIIVLQDGKVAETGTHQELIEKRGVYYDLVQAQSFGGAS
ncbi:thiol reductant ABC exporter subunit CydD [Bacillus swezeyi]|uniref:Thiol reductant ABC exporter subunit CydD n=1 Tax=Bacillus swezeyi TaxID=1925020 RepID=A0A5M8RWG3_9BACI|nr:thiol reductant ABC exporter subunit CydD [Bacillus swezeyi]KAA6451184.1 thiol reductant ABC exporter subunit CydD [Bacillus swezeyi]KAA6474688.1 thiol reductant ABC exporter subunit CydD [Bacillus swezeyi]TYS37658.1 thiol reductant ABC exporter subunit CydD [Bacillus swezeyi]